MGTCDLPLMSTVCDAVSGVVSSTGQAVTDGIGAWLAKSAGDLAASAADLAAKAVDETTAINLNASWFRNDYQLLLPIGLALIVGTFCLQLAGAAWRRDERALARAAVGTMTGVLFSFCCSCSRRCCWHSHSCPFSCRCCHEPCCWEGRRRPRSCWPCPPPSRHSRWAPVAGQHRGRCWWARRGWERARGPGR